MSCCATNGDLCMYALRGSIIACLSATASCSAVVVCAAIAQYEDAGKYQPLSYYRNLK